MKPQRSRTIKDQWTVATVLLTAWLAWGLGSQATSGADQRSLRELAAFRLSMGKLSKAAQANKTLEKLSEDDPALKRLTQFDKQKGPQSIDDVVARIGDHPRARAAVEGAGLSARDYVLTMYCFEQSTQALFQKESTGGKNYPPGASKENVGFVRNHLKEINRLFSDIP